MSVVIGAGWRLVHLTDREVQLVKDDWAYRRVLGEPGTVHLEAEPGMDRKALIDRAEQIAKENDARLADMVARQHAPQVAAYKRKQARLAPAFRTPEHPSIIGRKSA